MWLLAMASVLALHSPVVVAQSDPLESLSDEEVAELLELLETADGAEASGEWEQALELYRRAWNIVPLDQYRYRQALCLEQLGQYAEALSIYRELVDSEVVSVAEGARIQLTSLENLVRYAPVPVLIHTDPHDAAIAVDGEEVGIAEEGVLELDLTPGRHVVAGRRDGYVDREEVIVVESGVSNELVLSLDEAQAVESGSDREPIDDRRPSTLTWVLAGTSVACFAIGAGFNIAALDRAEEERAYDRQDPDNSRAEADRLAQEAEDFYTVAKVGYIAGAVWAAAAIVTYFVLDWPVEATAPTAAGDRLSVGPLLSPNVVGGFLLGTF